MVCSAEINKIVFSNQGWEGNSFELEFFNDGRVTRQVWFPYSDSGFYEGETERFDFLVQLISKLDFFNLQDSYEIFVLDGTTLTCTVVAGNVEKTVVDTTQGNVLEMWVLEKVISSIIDEIEWEKVSGGIKTD